MAEDFIRQPDMPSQRANLGPLMGPESPFEASRSRLSLCLAVCSLLLAALIQGEGGLCRADVPGTSAGPDGRASAEALLARGLSNSRGASLRLGLEQLRLSTEKRPGWRIAREALGVALLRAGRFGEASGQFAAALGTGLADSLSSGEIEARAGLLPEDANALFGLAVARHMEGDVRQAERLYRNYSELVGSTSRDAGRAYYRLHELFREHDVAWGDQSAELQKALAVDPQAASASLLPEFPDAAEAPELAPYLAPLELVGDVSDTVVYETLPLLSQWVSPADSSSAVLPAAPDELRVEILVGADGTPLEVEVLEWPSDRLPREAVADAARQWRFTPAASGEADVPARVVFGREKRAENQEASDPQD